MNAQICFEDDLLGEDNSPLCRPKEEFIQQYLKEKNGKIRRPPNRYFLYNANYYEKFRKENENKRISRKELNSLASKAWRNADPRTERYFLNLEKEVASRHKERFPNYTYNPHDKGKKSKKPIKPEKLGKNETILYNNPSKRYEPYDKDKNKKPAKPYDDLPLLSPDSRTLSPLTTPQFGDFGDLDEGYENNYYDCDQFSQSNCQEQLLTPQTSHNFKQSDELYESNTPGQHHEYENFFPELNAIYVNNSQHISDSDYPLPSQHSQFLSSNCQQIPVLVSTNESSTQDAGFNLTNLLQGSQYGNLVQNSPYPDSNLIQPCSIQGFPINADQTSPNLTQSSPLESPYIDPNSIQHSIQCPPYANSQYGNFIQNSLFAESTLIQHGSYVNSPDPTLNSNSLIPPQNSPTYIILCINPSNLI